MGSSHVSPHYRESMTWSLRLPSAHTVLFLSPWSRGLGLSLAESHRPWKPGLTPKSWDSDSLPWSPRSGLKQWLSLFQGEIHPGFTQSASSEETLPSLTSSLRKGRLFWKISLGSADPDDAPIAHTSSGKPSVALPGTTTNYPHVATACLQGRGGGVSGAAAVGGVHNP